VLDAEGVGHLDATRLEEQVNSQGHVSLFVLKLREDDLIQLLELGVVYVLKVVKKREN